MQGLIGPLKELAEFEELCKNKKKDAGMIRVCGCVNSQKSHMMYAIGDGCKYKVIACSSETKAKQIYEEYRFLDNNTYLYPAKDFLFYKADIRSKELVKQRMEGIQAVLSGTPVTIVTSLDGFMDHLAPKENIEEKVLKIQNDSVLKLDEMAERLSDVGYDREVQVEGPGQFAVRGGILDIYPLTEELPVRIEFWGDEVDSIRTFDVESQRSIGICQKLPSVRRWNFRREKKREYRSWIIFRKKIPFFFWMNRCVLWSADRILTVSYTHLRAHET